MALFVAVVPGVSTAEEQPDAAAPTTAEVRSAAPASPLALLQFLYVAAIIWGTWRAWQCGGEPRRLASAVWIVALYFWSVAARTLPLARYMVPAMAILILLIPFGIFRYSPAPASRIETPDHDDPVPGGNEPSQTGS